MKTNLGFQAKGRDATENGEGYQLRESPAHYKALFEAEDEDIDLEKAYFWNVKDE